MVVVVESYCIPSLRPAKERHAVKAARTWIDLLTLPPDNPLQARKIRQHKRFNSPLLLLMQTADNRQSETLETILPYVVQLWEKRIELQQDVNKERLQTRFKEAMSGRITLIITAAAEKK